jgi:Lysyl oxidase
LSRSALRALGLAATLALAVPVLASIPASAEDPGQSTAARSTASVSLWAPAKVTAYAYRNRTWTDLGLRLIAEGAPFEIWAHRPSYHDQVRAVWRSPSGDVALPDGSMTDFSGLERFVRLTIDRRNGDTLTFSRRACLNGYSERVRPDAPARSAYPVGCWYNPFSLGSVQGVQQGWATPILSQQRPLRIGPGRYTVTATVRPRYATTFGLGPAEATRTIKLTVSEEDFSGEGRARPSTVARPAAHPPAGPEGRAAAGQEGRAAAGPVPDLRSLPAWGMSIAGNGNFLRFSATVWNAGNSPLVVDGFRRQGEDEMDAYQYFFDADGNQTGYQDVGHLHWDPKPSHQHWHFEDFARYSLLDRDKVEAVRSKKEAFCLANTDAVDLTVPDAEWRPENTDLSTSCGDYSSLSIREVLAAGWGDTYTQYRAGQSFNLKGLPNGTYYVAVIANPKHHLVEASMDNNVALRKVRIGGREGHRTVKVPQVGIIEEDGYGGQG